MSSLDQFDESLQSIDSSESAVSRYESGSQGLGQSNVDCVVGAHVRPKLPHPLKKQVVWIALNVEA